MDTLTVWPSNLGKQEAQELVGSLMVRAMQHNYIELMQEHQDTKRASQGMQRLFGDMWSKNREQIWQWYDKEVTREVC